MDAFVIKDLEAFYETERLSATLLVLYIRLKEAMELLSTQITENFDDLWAEFLAQKVKENTSRHKRVSSPLVDVIIDEKETKGGICSYLITFHSMENEGLYFGFSYPEKAMLVSECTVQQAIKLMQDFRRYALQHKEVPVHSGR
jgi:hypothetical protein